MDKKSGFDFIEATAFLLQCLQDVPAQLETKKQPTVWTLEILGTYPVAKPPSMVDENL
jgi:hypothetical protein